MSNNKKIVVIFGATGKQGGSVIKSLLGDEVTAKEFKIRGITRDPSKSNAQALIKKGVECVRGDLNSKDSLRAAFKDAYAVFAMTNYWEKQNKDLEIQQGKNVADVAKEANVQHLIWSSLVNVTDLTKGAFPHVYHFDSKAFVEKYIRDLSIPSTFFMPGFYMSNIPTMMMFPDPLNPLHPYLFILPIPGHVKIPMFDAEDDTGKFVKAILKNRDQLLGKNIHAATDYYSPDEMVQVFNEEFPKEAQKSPAKYKMVDEQEYRNMLTQSGMNDEGALELQENMSFMTQFGYFGGADLERSLKVSIPIA
ncbi:MAG: hypothetical protein M1823_003512 [Watsoniomyces obsoletus]|nr:MAG: hypothetical protein M1823_003512 [Watsoniomyces obsoletus]